MSLGACASTDRTFGAAPDVVVSDLTELPMPAVAGDPGLQPFDTVEVAVLQDASLNGTYYIDADGEIAFPLVGQIDAQGLSARQLGQRITSSLRNGFINDPDVRVRPTEERAFSVSFGGEVARPGNVSVEAASTLLRGINSAGGVTEYAKTDDVLVMRTVENQKYIGLYNLEGIRRGNYPDPALAPGDIVMVGDSPAQRRLERLLPYFSLLTTSVILFDRVTN